MRWIWLAACLALPAQAERYGVQVGDTPPAVVANAASWKMGLDRGPGVVQPRAQDAAVVTAPPARVTTSAAPPDAGLAPRAVAPERARVALDWKVLTAPLTPPEPAFADTCRRLYRLDDRQIARAWRYFEPRGASYPARVANAVLRWIVVENRAAGGLDPGFFKVADPKAATARVGCGLRASPWATAGDEPRVEPGTAVAIRGRSGPFFRVEVNGASGWLPGTHLELR